MLVTVRDSDAASPWDVLAKNALHDQKLRDWKHASAEERAFDKLASVMQKVRQADNIVLRGDYVLVIPDCGCCGKHSTGSC